MPSLVPVCLFGVCSVSVRDAERLRGCGSGVFIGVEVDGEGGKWSGGTIEVMQRHSWRPSYFTYLHTYNLTHKHTHSLSHTHTHTHIHTQVHVYIPWIHKSVIKKVGCGTSHKYTKYTNLHCKILQILYNNSMIYHLYT